MKFGKNLACQQSKFPYLRYLNYKELKKVIKHDCANNTAWFDLHLQDEIEAVNKSFSLTVAHIQASLVAVAENIAPTISVRLREVMQIADQVELLRRFAVWNAVAVVKILKKRTKIFSGPSPPGLVEDENVPVAAHSGGDKITNSGAEQWLNKQLFFSGSDFAELQAQLESLAGQLGDQRLCEISSHLSPQLSRHSAASSEAERCPICLERCVDAVELSSCGHRFCWKCVVLGPIAFSPGEYRLSRCSVCRNEQPLDPTRNFKTVCSNQLLLLSELIKDEAGDASWSGAAEDWGLDVLYGSSGSAQKSKIETEKERQTLDSIGVHASTFFCALCCEPLLLEAVTTTPCKHHFHRVCLEKHAQTNCPLCMEELPAQLVMGRFVQEQCMRLQLLTPGLSFPHPCPSHASLYSDYPCGSCRMFTLSNLPPSMLFGPNGLELPSYIHCADPASLQILDKPKMHAEDVVYYSKNGLLHQIRPFPQSLIDEKRQRASLP